MGEIFNASNDVFRYLLKAISLQIPDASTPEYPRLNPDPKVSEALEKPCKALRAAANDCCMNLINLSKRVEAGRRLTRIQDAIAHLALLQIAVDLLHAYPMQCFLSLHEWILRVAGIQHTLESLRYALKDTDERGHDLRDLWDGYPPELGAAFNLGKSSDYPSLFLRNERLPEGGKRQLKQAYDLALCAMHFGEGFSPVQGKGKKNKSIDLTQLYSTLLEQIRRGVESIEVFAFTLSEKYPPA